MVYLLRGKPEEAAVSFAGIIPFVGDLAKLGKLKPVVIGENMKRVIEYAQKHGYDTINDFIPEAAWKRAEASGGKNAMLALNREWAQQVMREERRIIDIGPDFAERRAGKRKPSEFYGIERQVTKGYRNYVRRFIRFGKWRGGVPGLGEF